MVLYIFRLIGVDVCIFTILKSKNEINNKMLKSNNFRNLKNYVLDPRNSKYFTFKAKRKDCQNINWLAYFNPIKYVDYVLVYTVKYWNVYAKQLHSQWHTTFNWYRYVWFNSNICIKFLKINASCILLNVVMFNQQKTYW